MEKSTNFSGVAVYKSLTKKHWSVIQKIFALYTRLEKVYFHLI